MDLANFIFKMVYYSSETMKMEKEVVMELSIMILTLYKDKNIYKEIT
jgi:hypothetical protein